MKKHLLIACCIICFTTLGGSSYAQTFTAAHDTVEYTYTGTGLQSTSDGITTSGGSATIKWHAVFFDFPSDWTSGFGFCDNNTCYSLNYIWSNNTGIERISNPYTTGSFILDINLSTATSIGTHYLTVYLENVANPNNTKYITFKINLNGLGVANTYAESKINLYPNPAFKQINVSTPFISNNTSLYIYDITGKLVTSIKTLDLNKEAINIADFISGVYIIQIKNVNGQVLATKEFVKQ